MADIVKTQARLGNKVVTIDPARIEEYFGMGYTILQGGDVVKDPNKKPDFEALEAENADLKEKVAALEAENADLKERLIPVVSGEKTFACPHCDKTYVRQGDLDNHIKEKHSK